MLEEEVKSKGGLSNPPLSPMDEPADLAKIHGLWLS